MAKKKYMPRNTLPRLMKLYDERCCFCGCHVVMFRTLQRMFHEVLILESIDRGLMVGINEYGQCYYFYTATVEHLVDRRLNRAKKIKNLRLACVPCNRKRGSPNERNSLGKD